LNDAGAKFGRLKGGSTVENPIPEAQADFRV